MSETTKTSRAFLSAYRKGRQTYHDGKPRINPYHDTYTSYHMGVTFSRAFQKFWHEGYDDARNGLDEKYSA